MSEPTRRLWTAPYTSIDDHLEHEVTDEEFAAHRNGSPMTAVCGRRVVIDSSVNPCGAPCRMCRRVLAGREAPCGVADIHRRLGVPVPRTHTRHRRHGLVAHLVQYTRHR